MDKKPPELSPKARDLTDAAKPKPTPLKGPAKAMADNLNRQVLTQDAPPQALKHKLTDADVARLNAKYAGLGQALAAGLNYNVVREAAGDDPSKWTPEQRERIEALHAEVVRANKPGDEKPKG
jgi:hypothetical protein